MIQTLDVHNSCYIKKAGFKFAIQIFSKKKFDETVKQLSSSAQLSEPAKSYHFTTLGGNFSVRQLYEKHDIENRKWYAGTRRWQSTSKSDYWIAFKNEKDRTLALMLIS